MKKNLIIGLSIAAFIALFSGCGDTDSSSSSSSSTTYTSMVVDQNYTMSSGGSVVLVASDANVSITTSTDTNVTTAVLTSGNDGDAKCSGCE